MRSFTDMNIEKQLIECIANALNLDPNDLNLESKNTDYENWDSFGQIAIITQIESQFSIQFSAEDIYLATSVSHLLTKIQDYKCND